MAKEESLAQANLTTSLKTQYYAARLTLKNNGVDISTNVNENDLKQAIEWMKVLADFLVVYDGDDGLKLVIKVGNNRDPLTEINLSADAKKGKETLEKLSKKFPSLVSKADIDKFAKKYKVT